MEWLKKIAIVLGLAFGLAGCAADDLKRFDDTLAGLNQPGSSKTQSGGALAVLPAAGQSKPTQLIVSNDKKVAAAMNEALPTIKKVLGIHQCIKSWDSLRLLNTYAVPGENMQKSGSVKDLFPNNSFALEYHDLNKCVSVSVIDQSFMPALNALQFRVVYFADDSGETINFLFLFKKMDDGSWKISQFNRTH